MRSRKAFGKGDRIAFHISNSRSYFDVFVFSEGAQRDLVRKFHDLRGRLHPAPEHGYRDGFDWPEIFE